MFDAVQTIVLRQRRINQQLLVSSRVFETAAEAILITDRDGCIANVNEALLRITGYQREELMGRPAGLLYRAQDSTQDGGSIADAVRQQGEWRGETFFMTREHTPIPVMMAVSSLLDEQQNNLGNVAIVSDIREIKAVEARLREGIGHLDVRVDALLPQHGHLGPVLEQGRRERLTRVERQLDMQAWVV